VAINPSGGPLAANPMMAAGLARIGEAAKPILEGQARRALAHARAELSWDGLAPRFEAVYDIHTFKDQASLLLPLTGVQMHEDVFLDGAPIFPSAQKTGFVFPIRNKGVHRLRLSFSAKEQPAGDHVDLRFTIPKLAQNEITLQWAVPVQAVHSLHGWGEETLVLGPGQAVKEWHAQLGYEGTLQVSQQPMIDLERNLEASDL
jgi:hypothetical protein